MSLQRLISRKGMSEILFQLIEGDKTFTQIREATRLSMSNILARLREAEAHGLIERKVKAKGLRVEVKYSLSTKGREIIDKLLNDERLAKLFQECKELKRRIAEIEEEILQSLYELELE